MKSLTRQFMKRPASAWTCTHISNYRSTTPLQKLVLASGAAIIATSNPLRADMVNALNEITGVFAARGLKNAMKSNDLGSQILAQKPRISSETIALEDLEALPDDTLGKCYWQWLTKNGVTPDTRALVRYVEDAEEAYVIQRYREVHDFYHVLLQQDIDLLGESVVKAFEAVQTNFPMCYLAILGGVPNIPAHQRKDYFTKYLPWALQVGREAKLLLNYKFEDMLHENIDQLRSYLNITTFDQWVKSKSLVL